MKTCSCCNRTFSAESWAALKLLGYVGAFSAGGKRYAVALKNCLCGSTLGVEVELPSEVKQEASP